MLTKLWIMHIPIWNLYGLRMSPKFTSASSYACSNTNALTLLLNIQSASAEAPPTSQPSAAASSLRSTFRRASDSGIADAAPQPASTLQAPVLLANWTANQEVTGLAWLEGHTLAAVFEQGAQTTIRLFTPGAPGRAMRILLLGTGGERERERETEREREREGGGGGGGSGSVNVGLLPNIFYGTFGAGPKGRQNLVLSSAVSLRPATCL